MAASNLVIVESPAKAKTINKYLGKDYKVIASFGHIRDLPSKDGSVDPADNFSMKWQLGERAKKTVKEIVNETKKVATVYLATDPDREGEAISWHIIEYLKEKKLADKVEIKRVTFNAITKKSVLDSFANARQVDNSLVEAYLARRALDYLVGFNLSPILWRKLPGSRSAGRVQSVALRLICEREAEIEKFDSKEYWSIEAGLKTYAGKGFNSRLFSLDGDRIEKMTLGSEADANAAVAKIEGQNYKVAKVEKKQVKRNPAAPFITSTLQQEASRKLRFGASKTMRTAQKLYEGIELDGETVGLITYMRTDGVELGEEAISGIRELIGNKFGNDYVPDKVRAYKSKVKNAQEAHEAIRPTDVFRSPEEIAKYLGEDERKLYELIWKRTIACQMESALMDQASVDIANSDKQVVLRATGSIVAFDGFLTLYKEDEDDKEAKEDEKRLPPLEEGDALKLEEVTPNQHFTQPPPRYTEASLVKKMEELGIGRPSTYASIMQVLRDRNYVVLEQRRFIPDSRGRIVTSFLANFFGKYVEYNFTANLEEELDEITSGKVQYKEMLKNFWDDFSSAIDGAKDLTITEVIDKLDAELEEYLYPNGGDDKRKCTKCDDGTLSLKLGKFGAFIGCSEYPKCRFTRPVLSVGEEAPEASEPKELGKHPESGKTITLRVGPYGPYLQLELTEAELNPPPPPIEYRKDGKPKKRQKKAKIPKPKRGPIPQGTILDELSLELAVELLGLPREVGIHPETGEMIKAGIGRFGPFLLHNNKFKSIPASDPDGVLKIGLERAVELIAQPSKGRGGFGVVREIGKHPQDGEVVNLSRGRYGPYIKHGKTNATVPDDMAEKLEDITLDQAIEWITAKEAAAPAKKKKKKPAAKKKRPALKKKKAAAKKAAAKKK